MKRIESRNNPTIKSITALRSRREREESRLFYFEGVHLLEEYLRAGFTPHSVFVREDVLDRYAELISCVGCDVYEVTESVYDKLTDEKAPQGIFTVSRYLPNVRMFENAQAIKGNALMLVDLQDNGNVGTVIRTSAALDCDVLLCGRSADVYSAKTIRATMGALFTGNVYLVNDTESAIDIFKSAGRRVIASALTDKAETLGNFEVSETDCFVVGNEGNGLSESVIQKCDFTAIIPMSGRTESLNAASASSILLWEARRGRMN